MSSDRIGFIGVGLMGHGMAKNIVEKGFPLTVLAPSQPRAGRGSRRSAAPKEADNVRELAPSKRHRRDLRHRQPRGRGDHDRSGRACRRRQAADDRRLLDLRSRPRPSGWRRNSRHSGITLIDAPLSRTPKDAEEGTLDVMVGGDRRRRSRARGRCSRPSPAASSTPARPAAATRMKLLNNFVSLGYAALYSEALTLGAKAGLTPQVFDSVIRGGRMDCGFYQTFLQYVLERDPNAHRFASPMRLKDLTYLVRLRQCVGHGQPAWRGGAQFLRARRRDAGRASDYVPMLSDVIAEAERRSRCTEE